MNTEIKKIGEFSRPTLLGVDFDVHSYQVDGQVLFAISRGQLNRDGLLVRIQSPCLFGESFGVNSCDCGQQLNDALKLGAQSEAFLLIYLSNQEGRGHGLPVKIEAISLEVNEGLLMSESFDKLGKELDLRNYDSAGKIISDLVGGHCIKLLTNNPKKIEGLKALGIIVERVPLIVEDPSHECKKYLNNKREKMGHLFPVFEV